MKHPTVRYVFLNQENFRPELSVQNVSFVRAYLDNETGDLVQVFRILEVRDGEVAEGSPGTTS